MLMQHGKNSLWSLCLLLDGSRKGTSDWPFQMGVMGFTLCYPYSRKCHQLPLNSAVKTLVFQERRLSYNIHQEEESGMSTSSAKKFRGHLKPAFKISSNPMGNGDMENRVYCY